jgi:hypothetical protein
MKRRRLRCAKQDPLAPWDRQEDAFSTGIRVQLGCHMMRAKRLFLYQLSGKSTQPKAIFCI